MLGSKKRQTEPLTLEEEEVLWQKALLGSSKPQALLDTMLYKNGLYFALRSSAEHRQLRHEPCQIKLVEREGEKHTSSTQKISQKIVLHHADEENPSKCFVKLFKLCNSLIPLDRPKNPTPECRRSNNPVGYNKLDATVARL